MKIRHLPVIITIARTVSLRKICRTFPTRSARMRIFKLVYRLLVRITYSTQWSKRKALMPTKIIENIENANTCNIS